MSRGGALQFPLMADRICLKTVSASTFRAKKTAGPWQLCRSSYGYNSKENTTSCRDLFRLSLLDHGECDSVYTRFDPNRVLKTPVSLSTTSRVLSPCQIAQSTKTTLSRALFSTNIANMHHGSFYLLAAWAAFAVASASLHVSGQSEFSMGVLLPRQQGRTSLQTFTGALGGARAAAITKSDDEERPFEVNGDTFVRAQHYPFRSSGRPGWANCMFDVPREISRRRRTGRAITRRTCVPTLRTTGRGRSKWETVTSSPVSTPNFEG